MTANEVLSTITNAIEFANAVGLTAEQTLSRVTELVEELKKEGEC